MSLPPAESPDAGTDGAGIIGRLRAAQQTLNQSFHRVSAYALSGWRHKALTVFFLLLTAVVIGYIIIDNWELLSTYQWQIRPLWLLVAFLFLLADMFLGAWAWHLLTARLAGYNRPRRNIKVWWYANLARRMPGTVWFIASRVALYEQEGVSKRTISLLSGLELALIFISGIVMTLLTLPFWALPSALTEQLAQGWLWLLVISFALLLVHPRLLEKLWQRVSLQQPEQRLLWRDTLFWLLFYLLIWSVGGLVLFAVIRFFEPLPLTFLLPVMGMWALASSISLAGALTFTGLGLREISLTLLLAQLVPAPVALIISIFIRLIWLAGELVTALFSLKL